MTNHILIYFAAVMALALPARATVPPEVLEAESSRIDVISRVAQSTVAIFDSKGEGGGSGVLISPDGYALTNFHVTAPCGPAMKCGLADGRLYDAVLVGLDPPGDVALIKLLGRDDFPAAELGDSDAARMGDQVLVLGNPFLLAEDYQPTVTYGILSGTHRYQYPAGTLLEYADCLQTDASINPGNSGGPLFDAEGRLIGINGRGSFEKRGRVNVGVGYAISIDQIKRFLSHLKAGRVVDHATLGATVATASEGRAVVDDVLERSDAYRRGLRYGDYLTMLAGREITSANGFKNVLGTFPAGWKVPMEFARDGKRTVANVRLASLHGTGELESLIEEQAQKPVPIEPPGPEEDDEPQQPQLPNALAGHEETLPENVDRVYEKRSGFANYWFNLQHQRRLADACPQFRALAEEMELLMEATDSLGQPVRMTIAESEGSYRSARGQFFADYQDADADITGPPGSGGLLTAIERWRRLVTQGLEGFDEAYYFGELPFGEELRLRDCIVATEQGLETYFYFDKESSQLIGMEFFAADDVDACTINFSDFQPWESGELPFHWSVQFGDEAYVSLKVDQYQQQQPSEEANDE